MPDLGGSRLYLSSGDLVAQMADRFGASAPVASRSASNASICCLYLLTYFLNNGEISIFCTFLPYFLNGGHRKYF